MTKNNTIRYGVTMMIAGIMLIYMSMVPAYGASVGTEVSAESTDAGHVTQSGAVNTDLRIVSVDEDKSTVNFSLMIDNSMNQTTPICDVKVQLPSDDIHNHGFGLIVMSEPTWKGDIPATASIDYSSKEIKIHIENMNSGERYYIDIKTSLTDGKELPTEDILSMNIGLGIDIEDPQDTAWNSSSYETIPVSMGYDVPRTEETTEETTEEETTIATPTEASRELKTGAEDSGHFDQEDSGKRENIYHIEINSVSVGGMQGISAFSGSQRQNKKTIMIILAIAILISILFAIVSYYARRYIKENKRKFIRSAKVDRHK